MLRRNETKPNTPDRNRQDLAQQAVPSKARTPKLATERCSHPARSDSIRPSPTESDPMLQLHDPIRLSSQSGDANGNPVRRTRSTKTVSTPDDRRARLATFDVGTPFFIHPPIRVDRCSSVAFPPLARTPALTLGMALLLWRGMADRPA